jgi:TRAP-type C4-dicarboxylate transport system substrate-binding protein
MIMNEAKWKQISPADQAAINKLSGEALARRAGKSWDEADARGEKAMRDANIAITTATPQFIAEIKARTDGLEKTWIDKVKAKGVDGAEVLKAVRAELGTAMR